MNKGQISKLLRAIGLIYLTDWLRFYIEKNRNKRENKIFKLENPDVVLPPDYLIYESFQINYKKYYTDSIETATWLAGFFRKYLKLNNLKVLDWGCGPARIIRHLPKIIGNGCEFYGTDYNKKTIEWCRQNIKDVQFNLNTLEAKLPYSDNFFDIIYGISVLTHLSEPLHFEWRNELLRILKPSGILFLTTQGDNFKIKLTNKELEDFNNNKLIVRGKVKEGHRTFSAFHPKAFMENLFKNEIILEHIQPPYEKGKTPPQDIWIIRKNKDTVA